jgi:hypothetical protein
LDYPNEAREIQHRIAAAVAGEREHVRALLIELIAEMQSQAARCGRSSAGRDQAGRCLIVRHAAWRNTRRCLLDKTQSAAALFAVAKSTSANMRISVNR